MAKYALTLLLSLFCFRFAIAQKNVFTAQEIHAYNYDVSLKDKIKDYRVFSVPTDAVEDHVRATDGDVEFTLRLGDAFAWDYTLTNSRLYADNYLLRTEKGALSAANRPVPMRGYLQGASQHEVALTVGEDFLYGYTTQANGVFYLEPLRYLLPGAPNNLFIVYEQNAVVTDNNVKCAVTEKHDRRTHLSHEKKHPANEKSSVLACKLLELAIASDFLMFQTYGSVAAVEAHNVGVMNNVATDYDDSFNDEIQFEIVEQFVPTTAGADPISTSTDIGDVLDSFTAWAPGGFTNTHDLGQHWSSRDYDGTTIGLAWVGVVCAGFRYHVLEDFSSTAWALRVLTSHEMGHNFNQGHDDAGSGFIMAPSVNNTNTWSPASIAGINGYVPGLNCLSACPPDSPPVAAFSAEYTQLCTGSLVRFTDASLEAPTSWSWSFPGGTPSSSTEQNPIVQYNSPGNYTVTLTVNNNVGGNTSTQSNYISVGSSGTDFFFYEDFEDGLGGFTVDNPDGSITWTQTTVEGARYGNQAMFMNNFEYNIVGQRDGLVSPTIDFSGRTDAVLMIEYAYTNYDATFNDSLIVSVSSDNGANFLRVFDEGENGGGTLATRPTTTASFSPQAPADWCFEGTYGSGCLNIDLSAFSSPNTVIRIENYNGYGNNMYIENVALVSSCASLEAPLAAFQVSEAQGCAPFTVQYSDTSSGSPASWSWSFPGGTPASSTQQNPTVTYNTPGTYNATLTVTNSVGSDSFTQNSVVTVEEGATPDFTFNITGNTVNFTNTSVNGDSYFWEFGDTQTSSQFNPTHTYADEGTYTVTLTVTNDCGSVQTTQTVTIENAPTAAFTANTTEGCAPLSVMYSNQSTGGNATYSWSFPGGTPASSTQENPTVMYNTAGTYNATLTVTNSVGSDTQTQSSYITVNDEPTADFTAVNNDLTVDFTNTSDNATSFFWNFGDTNVSAEVNPSHTYANAGTYTVTLSATNDCGTATQTMTVEVTEVPTAPTAAFSADNTEGCAPLTVQFFNQSSDNAESYNWTFEGGTPATSTSPNPGVFFGSPGTYTVTLTVTNSVGSDTSTETNYITVNAAPTPDFTFTTDELTADFTNTSADGTFFSWNFGDDNTSIQTNPSHTYAAAGTYTVTLSATNDCGTVTTTAEVTVAEIPVAPTAAFTASETEGCQPFTVQYTNQSSANAESFMWVFAGGSPATSTEINPTVTYTDTGTYSVTLTAINSVGEASVTETNFITVNPLPVASFTASDNNLTVDFDNESVASNEVLWAFGDTETSTEINPTHTYAAEGTYVVTLTVSNDCGTDVSTQEITVSLAPIAPTAGFSAAATEGCEPFTVQFNNQSAGDIENFMWTFAGGTPGSSTQPNPIVTYDSPGIYDVSLTVSNEAGEDMIVQENYITVNPLPTADFESVPSELSVFFNNQSLDGTSFTWDFGDTNVGSEENPTHVYAAPGTYTVTLIAVNDCGSTTYEEMITVSLTPTAPTASFTADNTEGCADLTVQFTNQSSDNTVSLLWEFAGGNPATSTETDPTVTYNEAGSYTVTLTAINEAGSDIFTQTEFITVADVPVTDFVPSPNNLFFTFTNFTQNADSYLWEFGDDETSTEFEPVHEYSEEGTYTVTLTATNECGSSSVSTEAEASPAPVAPTAGFTAEATEGCAPFEVQLQNLSSSNATVFLWEVEGGMPNTSTQVDPIFTFNEPGTYTVSLTASNEVGEDTQTEIDFIIVGTAPTAEFASNTTGLTADFFNNSQNGGTYLWDFGDAETSVEENPTHTYTAEGTYIVTLTVSNDCGEDSFTATVTVGGSMPQAAFSSDVQEGCAPLTVQYFDNSTGNVTGRTWTFAGGSPVTSDEENPVVTYETTGLYDVMLEVNNDIGGSSILFAEYLEVQDVPTAEFTFESNGLSVSFTNMSEFGTDFMWDFGDGFSTTAVSPSHTYEMPGLYTVTLTAANDCGQTIISAETDLRDTDTDTPDFLSEFDIFPNPNDGAFTLLLTGETLVADRLEIRLLNVLGQVMHYETVNFTGSLQRSFDHRRLATGMYFLELRAGTQRGVRKVAIE